MRLNVINLQRKIPLPKKKIEKKLKKILLLQNKTKVNLSVVFVNDKIIKKLNSAYLHKNRPTDVLAFNLKEKNQPKKFLDGEIIISLDTAARNAKMYKTTFNHEVILYIVHGILHLCGFDDKTKKQKQCMRKREQYLLGRIFNDT